ncbi:hypothetical protein NL676_037619 [Syzygium grande]|nr:hypothetical protein NL676_037619 [Syzygium grande]
MMKKTEDFSQKFRPGPDQPISDPLGAHIRQQTESETKRPMTRQLILWIQKLGRLLQFLIGPRPIVLKRGCSRPISCPGADECSS